MSITEVFSKNFTAFWNHNIHEISSPHMLNGFYWVLLWATVCFALEFFLPKKINYDLTKRKGFWLDLFYVVFYEVIFMAIGFYAILAVIEFSYLNILEYLGIVQVQLIDFTKFPIALTLVLLFFIQDFVEWLAHYAMHRSDFLWSFHKIHHAPEEIGFASARRFHWVEILVFKTFLYLPFNLIGFSMQQYGLVVMTVFIFESFFTHCNIKTNFGFFNYIINNPETHFWHHARNVPSRYGVNYSSVLNIWDVLFGTYYAPKDKEPKLGLIESKKMPQGFFGQMFYPFKEAFSFKKMPDSFQMESVKKKVKPTRSKKKKKK